MWVLPGPLLSLASARAVQALSLDFERRASRLKRSVTWRGKPSAAPSWQRRLRLENWIWRLSGRIFDPSMVGPGLERWISSWRASRARPSPSPAHEKSRTTTDGFGLKFTGSLAKYDPDLSSWRMSQGSLLPGLMESLETWPRWASIRNGALCLRAPLVPHTHGTECSRWPTPDAGVRGGSNIGGEAGRVGKERPTLTERARRMGGKPNPLFWEWMIGLPMGWTAVGLVGMPSVPGSWPSPSGNCGDD